MRQSSWSRSWSRCWAQRSPPYDPNGLDISFAFRGAHGNHYLGFDGQGRDLFSRLLVGARTSMLGPLLVAALAVFTGSMLAVAAAWIGGWFDAILSMVLDVLFAFPGILLAVVAAAVFGPGLTSAVCALWVAYLPYVARVLRSAGLRNARNRMSRRSRCRASPPSGSARGISCRTSRP